MRNKSGAGPQGKYLVVGYFIFVARTSRVCEGVNGGTKITPHKFCYKQERER